MNLIAIPERETRHMSPTVMIHHKNSSKKSFIIEGGQYSSPVTKNRNKNIIPNHSNT